MTNKHNQRPNYGSNERKKHHIRGHDAALHHFQRSGDAVTVLLTSELKLPRQIHPSHFLNGVLTQYDAYTVTIKTKEQPNPIILFKGSILGLTKAQLG